MPYVVLVVFSSLAATDTSCNFNSAFHFASDNPHFQNSLQFAPLLEAHH